MNRFTLVRLPTLQAASERVAKAPATRQFRAGGIDIIDHLKERLSAPDELVELRAIGGDVGDAMRRIDGKDGAWTIGALVTLAQLGDFEDLGTAFAGLREAASSAATPGIRNAATIGGNLLQRPRCWYYRHVDLECLKKGGSQCFAITGDNRYHAILGGGPSFIVHPSTLAVALLAHDAKVRIVAASGERSIGIAELFVLPTVDPEREHSLKAGEIIVAVEVPLAGGPRPGEAADHRSAYSATKEKASHDWPLGEAAVRCTLAGGKMTNVRVALGHVAPVPWRSKDAEAVLEGQAPSAELFEKAGLAAVAKAKPLDHNGYKIPLVAGLVRDALHRATGVPF
jgi:xanthine dehydrogenase YagS FAD-binding subunit